MTTAEERGALQRKTGQKMCYQIRLRVALQKDTPPHRAQVHAPENVPLVRCTGEFPQYWIERGGCACDLVREKGAAIEGVVEVIQYFLEIPPVKRVEVIWCWTAQWPAQPEEVRLSIEEFARLNGEHRMASGVCYRVGKYNY